MSYKTKVTFYCDAVDCQVNQTFVLVGIGYGGTWRAQKGNGVVEPVTKILTKDMGWTMGLGRTGGEISRRPDSIGTFCPSHGGRESVSTSGLTPI
ncbi:hypothetical protein KNU13_gp05 [Gordonia phage Turuncu]|uniref:Uncharacterized protein n=1 Tax=Gordonia phage Turuncu TaxID=2315610 RepID=A0A386KA08_9CAUD|nr:hypothetical protein KNU13_gp05 [Gordonia phage Turuncu]AYD82093.1 hypothetical protein SEA_TURUNCU_5 [Gordonia phage Turuncu]